MRLLPGVQLALVLLAVWISPQGRGAALAEIAAEALTVLPAFVLNEARRNPSGVREPLSQSYAQSSQHEQYYELLASLWGNATEKPQRSDLAPLLTVVGMIFARLQKYLQ